MPDDALLTAAAAGDLDTAEGIEAQAHRTIADSRADAMYSRFHVEWLGVDEVLTHNVDEMSLREQLEVKTSPPGCVGCHTLMNPLGYMLDEYDGIGAYRTDDGIHPIDASGEVAGADIEGVVDGAVELGQRLAQSDQVRDCITEQWLRFALGRTVDERDEEALHQVRTGFEENGDLRDLIVAITTSDAFRYRRLPTE